jgi:hypothetical protein
MPPPIYKINKIRKVRQKYSKLREKVILQTGDGDNSKITDREVDFEGSLDKDEDDNGAENTRDKSLGASVELSELLALERDNPDDFGNPNSDFPYSANSSEAPAAKVPLTLSTLNSPGWNESRERLPATLDATTVLPSIEEDGYDDDYDYENDDDKLPADDFVKTYAFFTKAELRLRKLLPYKQYRVRRSSRLRICYTVIA